MVVVAVVEDFDSSQTPPPPAPPTNGARSVESRVEPDADAAAESGSGETDEFQREPAATSRTLFEKVIEPLGPIREPMLSRCWRAYLDSSPEAISHLVSEAREGRNPRALFVWFIKRGEHHRWKPQPLPRGRNLTAADLIEAAMRAADGDPADASDWPPPCDVCGAVDMSSGPFGEAWLCTEHINQARKAKLSPPTDEQIRQVREMQEQAGLRDMPA
jgi:hypothetical protein